MISLPTTPQSIRQILEGGIRLWKQSFRQIVPFAGIFAIAYLSMSLVLHALINQSQMHDKTDPVLYNNVGILWGSSFLYMVIALVVNACMIYRLDKIASNINLGFDTILSKGFKKSLPLLITIIIYGLIVALGSLLFLIPGIIAANYFLFSYYLVVTTERGIIDSFHESYRLVSGNWWHSFNVFCIILLAVIGFSLLIGILSMIINLIIYSITKTMFKVELVHSMEYAVMIMNCISFIIIYPLFYACVLSLLYDLQARKLLKSTQSIQA